MVNSGDLICFEKELRYKFNNVELLKEALTHRSYASEKKIFRDNQRLEYLGDSVIQIIITEFLFMQYPEKREGELTALRSALVQKKSLANMARIINLHDYLYLGKGEADSGGAYRESTLCDAFEALLGAVYLDSGLESSRDILARLISTLYSDPADINAGFNSKGMLQEIVQKSNGSKPLYHIKSTEGSEHNPVYNVEVIINGEVVAEGSGCNRKEAEAAAAEKAIRILQKKEGAN